MNGSRDYIILRAVCRPSILFIRIMHVHTMYVIRIIYYITVMLENKKAPRSFEMITIVNYALTKSETVSDRRRRRTQNTD